MTARLPTLFVSHGAPTFAIEPGEAGPALTALGERLPRPRAVLVVSPHWMTPEPRVTAAAWPGTVHDFGGFPAALYRLRYAAPGDPALAGAVVQRLRDAGWPDARTDDTRGLDHGAWVPLMHLFPQADVPVLQLSLPLAADAQAAHALGRALAPLANEGVLIVGSGSLTHNLYEFRQGTRDPAAYVLAFQDWVRHAVRAGDHDAIVHTLDRAPDAARAHPTPEHFLPLPLAAGAAGRPVPGEVIDGGVQHGVLSMDAYVFGASAAA